MEKFKELASKCEASVSIDVNAHRDMYQTVEEYFEIILLCNEDLWESLSKEVYAEMVKRNTIVEVRWYPDTPVGFFNVYHYDIDEAMKLALA